MTPEQVLELVCFLDTKLRVRLFFAAWTREQWWGTTREITKRAGVPHRRGEIELGKLVAEEFLVRHEKGARNQSRLVRFEAGPAAIKMIGALRSKRSERCDQNDRSETLLPTRRTQARDHARQKSDLSLDPDPMDQRVRPSEGVQGGTDGRTDVGDELAEHRNALIERVCREWRRWAVTESVAYRGIDRLLNARLTERELHKFLVDALKGTHPAFVGVQEHMRWGQSTSDERIKLWLNIERASREVGLAKRAPREDDDVTQSREERARAAAQAEERFKRLVKQPR